MALKQKPRLPQAIPKEPTKGISVNLLEHDAAAKRAAFNASQSIQNWIRDAVKQRLARGT